MNKKKHSHLKTNRYIKDWKKFKSNDFIRDFLKVNWDDIVFNDVNNVNSSFNSFFNHVNSLIDKHVPVKKNSNTKSVKNIKSWITTGIKKSIKQRNSLLKKFIRTNDSTLKNNYHNL